MQNRQNKIIIKTFTVLIYAVENIVLVEVGNTIGDPNLASETGYNWAPRIGRSTKNTARRWLGVETEIETVRFSSNVGPDLDVWTFETHKKRERTMMQKY